MEEREWAAMQEQGRHMQAPVVSVGAASPPDLGIENHTQSCCSCAWELGKLKPLAGFSLSPRNSSNILRSWTEMVPMVLYTLNVYREFSALSLVGVILHPREGTQAPQFVGSTGSLFHRCHLPSSRPTSRPLGAPRLPGAQLAFPWVFTVLTPDAVVRGRTHHGGVWNVRETEILDLQLITPLCALGKI